LNLRRYTEVLEIGGEDLVVKPVYRASLHVLVARIRQGLILVHFSAQLKRFLWDRGCLQGLSRGCLGVTGGIKVSRV